MKILNVSVLLLVFGICILSCKRNKTTKPSEVKKEINNINIPPQPEINQASEPPTTNTRAIESSTEQTSSTTEQNIASDSVFLKSTSSVVSDFVFSNEGKGCGDFFLFKLNADQTKGINISGKRDALKLTTSTQSFDLSNRDIQVVVHEFDGPAQQYYCDDVAGDDPNVIQTWKATEGKVYIKIDVDNPSRNPFDMMYTMSLKLESAVLKNEKSETKNVSNLLFEKVIVGWFPG